MRTKNLDEPLTSSRCGICDVTIWRVKACDELAARHAWRQGPAGGWRSATTADKTRPTAAGVRTPTVRRINAAWAVNSLPGRAKLATISPPDSEVGGIGRHCRRITIRATRDLAENPVAPARVCQA